MHEELIAELEERQSDIDFLIKGNTRFYARAAAALRQDAETIAKLRKAIEDAPCWHDAINCRGGHTCWKKDALA